MKNAYIISAITTYYKGNEAYKIVIKDDKYIAINTKYIKNCKVTKELRGPELFPGETLEECIENIDYHYKIKELQAQGYDIIASIALLYGATEEEALEQSRRVKETLNK